MTVNGFRRKVYRVNRRRKADPRAQASGFGVKLRRWLDRNRDEYEAGRDNGLPRNPRQLALRLTALGEDASDNTVRTWTKAISLPESRYVAQLERLMGAPWSYLDDPATSWPLSRELARFYQIALSASPAALAKISAALAAEDAHPRGRAP